MSLIVPSFPNKYRPDVPLVDVFARIVRLEFNVLAGTGAMTVGVWKDAESHAAGLPMLDTLQVDFGVTWENGEHFPTLPESMADPTFAAVYAGLKDYLEVNAKKHPDLADATQV